MRVRGKPGEVGVRYIPFFKSSRLTVTAREAILLKCRIKRRRENLNNKKRRLEIHKPHERNLMPDGRVRRG
jgi:hypothetical protein